jgi:hypothetical protein
VASTVDPVRIGGSIQMMAASTLNDQGINCDFESEFLALANAALYPNHLEDSFAAQRLTANPSLNPSSPTHDSLDEKEKEMLDLADLPRTCGVARSRHRSCRR